MKIQSNVSIRIAQQKVFDHIMVSALAGKTCRDNQAKIHPPSIGALWSKIVRYVSPRAFTLSKTRWTIESLKLNISGCRRKDEIHTSILAVILVVAPPISSGPSPETPARHSNTPFRMSALGSFLTFSALARPTGPKSSVTPIIGDRGSFGVFMHRESHIGTYLISSRRPRILKLAIATLTIALSVAMARPQSSTRGASRVQRANISICGTSAPMDRLQAKNGRSFGYLHPPNLVHRSFQRHPPMETPAIFSPVVASFSKTLAQEGMRRSTGCKTPRMS